MAKERTQRRLAAILAADVAGYSRLMGTNEEGTLAHLKEHRRQVVDPKIDEHRGRIVKTTGDGLLAEFASVIDALRCAVEIQRRMADRNAQMPTDERIDFRLGLNVGDIMFDAGDIFGDGVNVAARLEALAEPGGICVSARVQEDASGKIDLLFEDMGEQKLKNIARPVRAYRVKLDGLCASSSPVSTERDRPSIAILPFTNMSGDPEQEYFSDGLTEDLITELSRFKDLLVVARNSTFTFKGKAVDVKEAGHKLNARHVVEGSVRKVGNRVRITAQLTEAATGNHLWAEHYDRDLEDIFAVQDEVVRAVASAVPGRLNRLAVERLQRKPPNNMTAYDCELRGRWAYFHLGEGIPAALDWYRKAIAADPDYGLAHAGLAMTSVFGVLALGLPAEPTIREGRGHARKAVALDGSNPVVNACAAFTYHIAGDYMLARDHAQRAAALNPNDPFALYVMACALSYTGDPEQALDWFARSARLEPYAVDDQRLDTLCDCHYMLRDYRKVVEIHETYQNTPAFLHITLAAAHAQLGQLEMAHSALREYERLKPSGHDIKGHIKQWMRMCSRASDVENWLEGFRKAGIDV